jgi:hypothetical protein
MQFSVGRPDLVRAINQRWLLKFWMRSLGESAVPRWQSVEAENLNSVQASLSFVDVIPGSPARFRIRFHGETIAKVYGSVDCRGRHLDEIIPPHRYAESEATYTQVLRGRCPVYTIHDLVDGEGRLVHYERLLLPFGSDGDGVDRILASFEFICADGAFDAQKLLMKQASPPVLRLAATIEVRANA